MSGSVLYDAPGPRAQALYRIIAVLTMVALAGVGWFIYDRFDATGEWEGERWKPFIEAPIWENFLLPGIRDTFKAFAVASVASIIFGLIFGVGRMSQLLPIRLASGAVVEFFRAIPLLILMIFIWLLNIFEGATNIWFAVTLGLVLYNGSVLAEVVRAGVNSLPKGQSEAGLAIGLTRSQVMRQILLPQALRAMLPAVIAQLVVLMKDTALGYIIGYSELLRQGTLAGGAFRNVIQTAIVVAAIYIAINYSLGRLATWVEARLSRQPKTAAPVGHADDVLLASATAGGAAAGHDQ